MRTSENAVKAKSGIAPVQTAWIVMRWRPSVRYYEEVGIIPPRWPISAEDAPGCWTGAMPDFPASPFHALR